MNWRPKNVNDSLLPMNTVLAFLGYAIFQYPSGKRRFIFSVVYAIIVTLLYWITFFLLVRHSISREWFKREEKIYYSVIGVNFAIAVMAQYLSWYHAKTRACLVNRIANIDATLHELGTTIDYTKFFNVEIMTIIYWMFTVCSLNAISMVWHLNGIEFEENLVIASLLHFPLHFNSIVDLQFIMLIKLIKDRFSKANELLEKTLKPVNNRSVSNYSWGFSDNKVNDGFQVMSNRRMLKTNENRKKLIITIKHVHLELTMISKIVDHMYGLKILFGLAAQFVSFTGLFYTEYMLAVKPWTDQTLIRTIVAITWQSLFLPIIMSINYSCEIITSETQKTSDLLHLPNQQGSEEFLNEIRQFSVQLMINPVRFSPVGFFTLGLHFVRAFFGTVLTYVVILIQMGPDLEV